MTRITAGSRVVYLDRSWKLSLACFLLALGVVAFPMIQGPSAGRDAVPAAGLYGGMFALVALLLLSSRMIAIDPARGILQVVERRPLSRTRRTEYSLSQVRVRTSSNEEGADILPSTRIFYIWIEVSGGRRIPFMGRLSRQEQVHDLVVRLNQDLRASPLPPPLE